MRASLFLSLVFTAATASAQPRTVPQAVAAVQQFYGGVSTYNATFTQQYVMRLMNTTLTSAGVLTYQRPGKASFAYTQPPGNRVVINGQQVWVRQASTGQTYTTQMQMPAVLSFLSGGQFGTSFNFTFGPPFQGGYVLVGTPTASSPYFTNVLFYVDSNTSQVIRVLVVDAQGNRNRFDFLNVSVNTAVPPQTFVTSASTAPSAPAQANHHP